MVALSIHGLVSDCSSTPHQRLTPGEILIHEQAMAINSKTFSPYIPSRLEKKVLERSSSELHYNLENADECDLFQNTSRSDFYQEYRDYLKMLDSYTKAVQEFDLKLDDIRTIPQAKKNKICQSIDDVLKGSFQVDVALSKTREGYVEPLLPPLRHPRFCLAAPGGNRPSYILNSDYLVHDFGLMCRNLNSDSKTVFVDMGASLQFNGRKTSPAMELVTLYRKFGIQFDHYYAFEATKTEPKRLYERIPKELLTSFHWFNVPVQADESSKQNPWTAIVSEFTESDLVIVKLDIDATNIELPLVDQLGQDKNARIVDHFYFEHHVRMKHMGNFWMDSAFGTLQHSLNTFANLRNKGIAAHSWV